MTKDRAVARAYKRIIRAYRDWLSQSDMMAARKFAQLQVGLNDESFDGLFLASTSLPFLSIFHGSKGLVAVEDGLVEDGAICRSLLYRFWEVRIRVASATKRSFLNSQVPGGGLSILIPNIACLVFAFVALGDKGRVELMLDALRVVLGDESSKNAHLDHHAANFAVWLGEQYLQEEHSIALHSPDREESFGVYSDVIQAWGASGVVELMPSLLKYHYANTDDDGRGRIPCFKWSPFDAIPFEVIAIVRLNSLRGIDFSPVLNEVGRHLMTLDAAATDVADLYLDRIEEKFGLFFS